MNTKTNKHNKTNTIKYVYQQKHNGQPCIRMCLHTELSTELYEAKNLVFNLLNRTLGNSNLNILAVLYNLSISSFKQFHKNRFIAKSNIRLSEAFNGQASRPYNQTDTHLLRTSCNVTSSDAVLP